MPPLVLESFDAAQKNYIQQLNNNNTAIMAAVNALQAQVLASAGDGADLILDVFDRPGIVGAHAYRLDLENYSGGEEMLIGFRPAFDATLGDVDQSVLWGTFAGERQRVKIIGDRTLNFSTVTVSGPTTVYVRVGSDGEPQVDLSDSTPNVVYLYSMTWDGISVDLETIKRMAPILGGNSLLQDMAAAPQQIRQLDTVTDWLDDAESQTGVVLMGSAEDNEAGIDGQVEVLGFFLHIDQGGPDGFECIEGGADTTLELRVVADPGDVWSEANLLIDCSEVPDDFFVALGPSVQSRRFITEITRFYLERVAIGGSVVNASNFTWGVVVRPLFGTPVPKDDDTVGQV